MSGGTRDDRTPSSWRCHVQIVHNVIFSKKYICSQNLLIRKIGWKQKF